MSKKPLLKFKDIDEAVRLSGYREQLTELRASVEQHERFSVYIDGHPDSNSVKLYSDDFADFVSGQIATVDKQLLELGVLPPGKTGEETDA